MVNDGNYVDDLRDIVTLIEKRLKDESSADRSFYSLSSTTSAPSEDHGTSQICVVDMEGNAVSITSSTNTE